MSSMALQKPTSFSAPAKVILFGEHAVVYGQPAIAVPVGAVRAQATISPASRFQIDALDTGQILTEDDIKQAVDDALSRMAQLILAHFQGRITATLPSARITLSSQIPPASGLGSGAAVATALGRAMAAAMGQPIDNEMLNRMVFEVERIFHGTPSGIDNTVIVYEQPIYFVRETPIERLSIGQPFHLLIGDTGHKGLTRIAVGDVRALYEAHPKEISPILDQIGHICRQARSHLENTIAAVSTLGALMNENHALLQQLTVSSPELDRLVVAARDAGALGAKMSGGGRGGNMIALVDIETASAVHDALIAAGAVRVIRTEVS